MLIFSILNSGIVLFECILLVEATSHWVVNENGRIQGQVDSVYAMKRPYDLVEFLKQDERAQNVRRLFAEMVAKKAVIDERWAALSTASEIEKHFYSSDDDCLAAKRIVVSDDRIGSTSSVVDFASDRVNLDKMIPKKVKNVEDVDLDCAKFSKLDFSMTTFPHLQVLNEPWNITWSEDVNFAVPATPSQIHHGLTKNRTSWFHYNLASLHWRAAGDSQKAIDCAKRALYFTNRQFKDTPTFNLGVMLHRANCLGEAAILLHSSVDHAPHKAEGHFALGNVYVLLGDYNRSIACYDNVLRLLPDWQLVRKTRHTIICHHKLKATLDQLQVSLHEILEQLQEYNTIHMEWINNHEQILNHQQSPWLNSYLTLSGGGDCSAKPEETPTCDRLISQPQHVRMDAISLQLLLSKVESQAQKLTEQMPLPDFDLNRLRFEPSYESEPSNERLKVFLEENNSRQTEDSGGDGGGNFQELADFYKYQIK